MTSNETDRTAADLLAKLKAAWGRQTAPKTRSPFVAAVEPNHRRDDATGTPQGPRIDNDDQRTGSAATVPGCRLHLPPFDAVETPDARRGGWVRMTCRQCGKFLGYAQR